MHQRDRRDNARPIPRDEPARDLDLVTAIIPRTVQLEPIHPNRERSITDAIEDGARDRFERIGLAAERALDSLLRSGVRMDCRRVLAWRTRLNTRHTIELDGVTQDERREKVFLEYKITFNPERAIKKCREQLHSAHGVYRVGRPDSECRGVGIVVDCGSLVGLPRVADLSSVPAAIDSILRGNEKLSVRIVSLDEVAQYFRRSQYGRLLSPECLRAAYNNRLKSDSK